jgi:hypothetical protein
VALNAGASGWDWRVPTILDLATLAALGIGMVLLAMAAFNKTD